jgi:hypothetical protein
VIVVDCLVEMTDFKGESEILDASDKKYGRFVRIVGESKKLLVEWSKYYTGDWGRADKYIGGLEGLSYNYDIARIDTNGDGWLTKIEYDEFMTRSEKTVEKSMQLLLNSGVVGTLLLGFFFPLASQDLEYSDEAIEHLGESGIKTCKYIYFVLLYACTTMSFLILYISMRVYVHLGYWLVDIESKLEYLSRNPMLALCILDQLVIFFAPVLLIPAISVASSPYIAIIAAAFSVIFIILTYYIDSIKFGRVAEKRLECDVLLYLGRDDLYQMVTETASSTNKIVAIDSICPGQ